MNLLDSVLPDPEIVPGYRMSGRLAAVLSATGEGFRTTPVDGAVLDHEGIVGDVHRGFVRPAGPREPWYPRGVPIRSGRQLSVVSLEDLADVAARLGLDAVDPALIGANLVLEGLPRLSFLPAGTRLLLAGGASLVVEAQNAPCRDAGRALAAGVADRPELELAFVEAARRRRGVVASVERTGPAVAGTDVTVRVPEQWIYRR